MQIFSVLGVALRKSVLFESLYVVDGQEIQEDVVYIGVSCFSVQSSSFLEFFKTIKRGEVSSDTLPLNMSGSPRVFSDWLVFLS